MVSFQWKMLSNRNVWQLTSRSQKRSVRKSKKGSPQGSVLALMLFNIYIHELAPTTSKKYSFDGLAILLSKIIFAEPSRRASWKT